MNIGLNIMLSDIFERIMLHLLRKHLRHGGVLFWIPGGRFQYNVGTILKYSKF